MNVLVTTVTAEQFNLHDGEDESKTKELHRLLEPLRKAGHDWDGWGEGVTIMLMVNVDDTIQVSEDGWVRVVRATKMPDVSFTEKDM